MDMRKRGNRVVEEAAAAAATDHGIHGHDPVISSSSSRRRRRAPKGHFVVYVGSEMARFVLPTSYLKDPSFQQLLHNAAEEYGFHFQDKIFLPCDQSTFLRLTSSLLFHKNIRR
ncbi:hypothetical protein Dimus_025438 [Dionaea muscipula]